MPLLHATGASGETVRQWRQAVELVDHLAELGIYGSLIPETTEQLLADADEWGPSGVLGLGALVLLFR